MVCSWSMLFYINTICILISYTVGTQYSHTAPHTFVSQIKSNRWTNRDNFLLWNCILFSRLHKFKSHEIKTQRLLRHNSISNIIILCMRARAHSHTRLFGKTYMCERKIHHSSQAPLYININYTVYQHKNILLVVFSINSLPQLLLKYTSPSLRFTLKYIVQSLSLIHI